MYKAILFAPDGDFVTDFRARTKKEVIKELIDIGSKWCFYPLHAIIKDKGAVQRNQRLVEVDFYLDRKFDLKMKSVNTAIKIIRKNKKTIVSYLNG